MLRHFFFLRAPIGAVILALALMAGSFGSALADTAPTAVSGPFSVRPLSNPPSFQSLDGLCRINLTATFDFMGNLVGTFTAPFTFLQFGPCTASAVKVFQASGTYVGSVGTATGTFDFLFIGAIDAQHNARGDLVVLRGTGGLSHLQGTLHLAGTEGVGGTYEGVVRLE
jgi:hypothetical protein